MIEATSTINTVVLVALAVYALVGAIVIGSWLGGILFNTCDYLGTKKKLAKLEQQVKLAELKAREIKAGL